MSKDYLAWTSVVGLVPWALMLMHGSGTGATLLIEIVQSVGYLVLAAGSAALVGNFRFASKKAT